MSNEKGRTVITEMARSIYGAGLAGKIKTHFVSDTLSRKRVAPIQVQLSSSPELRGQCRQETRLGAVSPPKCKAMSLDELAKGWTEKKRGPVTSAKA